MKPQSLISNLSHGSNLSHLSNVSYRGPRPNYTASGIFQDSLIRARNEKISLESGRQEQIGIESLNISDFKVNGSQRDCIGAFNFWTKQLNLNIEGTSDNEQEEEGNTKKQIHEVKEVKEVKEEKEIKKHVHKKRKESSSIEFSADSGPAKLMKNETKNIPKNFGKAIIIFIEKNKKILTPIVQEHAMSYDELVQTLKLTKKKINTIADLRDLWGDSQEGKCLRILSNHFLRRHSLQYIYNSRIKTRICHSKYKRRLQEALTNPFDFNHIKEY